MELLSRIRRGALAVVVAVVATLGVGTAVAPAAQASPIATVMATTQRMTGPSLQLTQVGWYSVGSGLTLNCYQRGQSVKGYYSPWIPGGYDNLWYQVNDGYWVADVDINTGSNNPVTGACAPASTREDRAVAWARSMVGSDSYPGLCELFVENAYGTSGRYGNAISAFSALQSAGQIHTTGTPTVGALVFSRSALDGGNGHVMIYVGGGQYVSGGVSTSYGSRHTVQLLTTPNPTAGGTYLGWGAAPSSWAGR